MEEHFNSLPVTHLLQHTLRTLCLHENSQWVYAVYWRILPRNFPPPKWDSQGRICDRSRGNRRNWILVWEDGFCNFAKANNGSSTIYGNSEFQLHNQGLQPELFFKMSHEIYNYGEGMIGKVAAEGSYKWIHNEPNVEQVNLMPAWNHDSVDSHPRTWEAQFQFGIKTIALVAIGEGVLQLGAIHKVIEDLNYVVMVRKKLGYIERIPGVLLPHPSRPLKIDSQSSPSVAWNLHNELSSNDQIAPDPMKIAAPSMSSLEALLSKLPSVLPIAQFEPQDQVFGGEEMTMDRPTEENRVGDNVFSPFPCMDHHDWQQFG